MALFHDDKDRYRYCEILDKTKRKYGFALYAYCLMDNHVHLLVKEEKSPISVVMKSIGVRYSMYFNNKYGRVGHLFQNRFRSQAINSEHHLLTCARYIHNNPLKAGITTKPEDYSWTSLPTYLGKRQEPFLDQALLLGVHGSPRELKQFTDTDNEDSFMDFGEDSDEEEGVSGAIEDYLREQFGLKTRDLGFLTKESRDAVIALLKSNFNVSERELAEILNLSKDKIHRA